MGKKKKIDIKKKKIVKYRKKKSKSNTKIYSWT